MTKKEAKIIEEAEARTTMPVAPPTGLFGQLEEQMKSVFSEILIERMDALNELAATEKETNRIMKEEWLPMAKLRQEQYRQLAVKQGYAVSGDGSPD